MNSISGHSRLASATLVPVFTPNFFASTLAAMHTVVSASIGTTPTGRPRSLGSTCCSTEAKYELKSTRSDRSISAKSAAGRRERPARGLHELAAVHERVGDIRDRLDRAARARDVDGAEVEDAPPEALVHPQRL